MTDHGRYDRNKLSPKDIHSVQYIACMNPTAGSFTINPRDIIRILVVFKFKRKCNGIKLESQVKW